MKLSDIRAGSLCTVGWFQVGHMAYRRDYLAHGRIVCRRGHRIKFMWESGDDMNADFISTPATSTEQFWVDIMDIKSATPAPNPPQR